MNPRSIRISTQLVLALLFLPPLPRLLSPGKKGAALIGHALVPSSTVLSQTPIIENGPLL
jgi:hypothetical protein